MCKFYPTSEWTIWMNYLPYPPCLPSLPYLLPGLPCSSSSLQGRHHQHLPHPQRHCHPRPSTCQSRPTSSRKWEADQMPGKPWANAAWSSQPEASPSMGLPPPSQGQTRCTWASLGTWSPQDPPKRKKWRIQFFFLLSPPSETSCSAQKLPYQLLRCLWKTGSLSPPMTKILLHLILVIEICDHLDLWVLDVWHIDREEDDLRPLSPRDTWGQDCLGGHRCFSKFVSETDQDFLCNIASLYYAPTI